MTSEQLWNDFGTTVEWLRTTVDWLENDCGVTENDSGLTWEWPQGDLHLTLGLENDPQLTGEWLWTDWKMTTEGLANDHRMTITMTCKKFNGLQNDHLMTSISHSLVRPNYTKSSWSHLNPKMTFCWLFVDFMTTLTFYWVWIIGQPLLNYSQPWGTIVHHWNKWIATNIANNPIEHHLVY